MSSCKTLSLSTLLVAALLAAPASLFFSTTVRAEEEKKEKSELHKKMELIDEGMKKLKRTLRKSDQNEVSLKVIGDIVDLAKACREMTPSHAGKLSEPDRKKFIDGYHASMDKLIETMEQMKTAVKAGDLDKAKELRTTLKDMEEDGHDRYMESDERDAAKTKDKDSK